MNDIVIGIAALTAGLLFCFFGAFALRIVITFWGGFVGFTFGAGLVSAIWDEGFLSQASGWIVGFVFALIFAALSYLYYWVAVLLATMSLGFAAGAALMGAMNISWNWLIVLVGIAFGALLGIVAIVADLPGFLLIWLSALGGSSAAVTGLMLLTGAIDSSSFDEKSVTANVPHDWFWFVTYVALVVVSVVAQSRRRWTQDPGQVQSSTQAV